ncbi:MAG TPA: hypothetical protein VMB71_10385, partial [Acetobacteraceae bacterium]|nr:hypothetical protein [Acetobacteraceae bacterium]
ADGNEAIIDYFGNTGWGTSGNLIFKGKFLYGPAKYGGGMGGGGSIFKAGLDPFHKVKKEFAFGSDTSGGVTPNPGLLRVGNGFYGTTEFGGASNQGAVFKITP